MSWHCIYRHVLTSPLLFLIFFLASFFYASIYYYYIRLIPTDDPRWAKPEWPPVETVVNNGSLADEDVDCASSEDCLHMDIWAPANSQEKKLPVIIWTYGGGFTGGSKSQNTREGLFNLSTKFVFVAYNYRLGVTGLANGPTFLHEGGTSNTALWDVQQAFQWTKKYINAFGGDPDQITLLRFAGHAEQSFDRAYVMSPGFQFWQNVSAAAYCGGGHLDCMRKVDFTTLANAATDTVDTYTYQFQPRVEGDFVADTYEANLYQKRFNFSGPLVITHEQHEANSAAWSGVNTTEDVSTYLRIFFPAITDDVINKLLELYPESEYSSPGLRFSDMKQSFDLTAHNLAVTQALGNKTWNAMVALGAATHGTNQNYYWYSTYTLSSSTSATGGAGNSSSNSTAGTPSGGMGAGPGSTSVNATIAVMMQKYLMSFVLTGNLNTKWSSDKLVQLMLNDTFYLSTDDLAMERTLLWNQALWY
ncbi:alpha/beta-hydrolase [Glonium stellatum]|uniref:Alpha/beta-hydrolase n=1 Tax=Glonium stellatum TaxID=574774 RepID=A0A8E2EQ27_9PEZI|nr:alpha/beta-hydrolase [Glonium stellatum]